MKRKVSTPNAPLDLPDTSIYNKPEALRAQQTFNHYFLSEEERLAIIEKYGAPTRPYRPSSNGYDAKRRGGKGA